SWLALIWLPSNGSCATPIRERLPSSTLTSPPATSAARSIASLSAPARQRRRRKRQRRRWQREPPSPHPSLDLLHPCCTPASTARKPRRPKTKKARDSGPYVGRGDRIRT